MNLNDFHIIFTASKNVTEFLMSFSTLSAFLISRKMSQDLLVDEAVTSEADGSF